MNLENVAIFAPTDDEQMALVQPLEQILAAVRQYTDMDVFEKAKPLMASAELTLFSGKEGTQYLKKKGHRALTVEDAENLVRTLGSEEDQATVVAFNQAQIAFTDRLKTTKAIRDIMEAAQLNYRYYFRRRDKPADWTPEEIVKVVSVLQEFQI